MSYVVNVSLPSKLAKLAKKQVSAGYYSSISEIVREALRERLLSSKTIPSFDLSSGAKKTINKAIDEFESGESVDFDKL